MNLTPIAGLEVNRCGGDWSAVGTPRNAQARPAPDITCIPTLAGFLCLAIVLDVFNRRVVG